MVALVRWAAARALGMRGLRFPFGGAIENQEAASRWRRALVVLAGLAASYLLCGVLFGAAILLGGRVVSTTEVDVAPGGPAEAAGMESGDRVVSIAGQEIGTWEDLKGVVDRHAGAPVEVVVRRGEEERRFTITPERTPGDQGRIGVFTVPRRDPVGVGSASRAILEEPAGLLAAVGRGWVQVLAGKARAELAGPAAIVRGTGQAARWTEGTGIYVLAAMLTYAWPLAALAAVVSVPRRARKKR